MIGHPGQNFQRWCVSLMSVVLSTSVGCGITRSSREPDHVYSTTTPQMLEHQAAGESLPVEARYPDEQPTAAVHHEPVLQQQATGIARPEHRSHLQPPSRAAAPVILTSFQAEELAGPEFLPAEPRLETDPQAPQHNQMETVAASPLADLYPDEYVFDGGDRQNPASLHTTRRSGLDTEDTVAAFRDHTGEARTAASNRVAVYAPRFGSVRTVTGLVADTKVDKAAGARDSLAVGNFRTGRAAQENVHGTVLYGLEVRDRADGMQGTAPPMQARRTENLSETRKIDEGHEGRLYSSSGSLHQNRQFRLAEQVQNAVSWTRDQFPVITATTVNASEITARFKVQQTVGIEDERKTAGNIRIVKLADREIAQSGDTVTFTIRFENTGDFDVYDVTIVDNLTPRLEYLQGSAAIDAKNPGEVSVEPNGEGSSVLTFRLDHALKGHTSGTIRFEATVR